MTNRRCSPRFYLPDILVVGYSVAMIAVLLIFGRPLENYLAEVASYAALAGIAALIVRFADPDRSRFVAAVRWLYPAALFTWCYELTAGLMFLFHDRFLDASLTAFERSLFGFNPTLYIDAHLLTAWVTEPVSAAYFSYYFMIPVFVISVFIKRHDRILRSAMSTVFITFIVSYTLFWLYPVEGPRWFFAEQYQHPLQGFVFRRLVELVIEQAAVRGGCMPSSHLAVALVILLYCFRFYRKAAWWLLPVVIGLAIGTVWGRFHYVSDLVVGAAIGFAVTFAVWKWYPVQDKQTASRHRDSRIKVQHVQ